METGELDFRLLFEASPDVLLVLLPDAPRYTMVAATRTRLEVAHATLEQTIGRGLFELFPDNPDDPAATGASSLRASLERVLATRAPDTMAVQKYDIRGPDGSVQVRYGSPRNLPVLSPSGDVLYILHRVEDVTELERANRELDAFSYSVSHDLRAPLRAVQGFSSVLAQDYASQLPPQGRKLLDDVIRGASRMAELIEDLLRLSRLGRQPLSKQAVTTSALVADLLAELRREQGGRQVEVRVDVLPDVVADLSLLRQVFVNLLSNAFKFTRHQQHPIVEIGCRVDDGETVFFVRDNGEGFDMQYAAKLFGVFQRMHRQDEFEGTGVGLSIVSRIIQRHGGRVWAEAAVGRGATLFFSLPNERA